jgi:hypothetical protein
MAACAGTTIAKAPARARPTADNLRRMFVLLGF